MKKKSSLSPLSETLSSVFHEINIDNRMEHVAIFKIWKDAVGERIAEETHPEMIRNDLLFVNVSNSLWMQELCFLRDKILEKVNNLLTSRKLKQIRFKIGGIPKHAHNLDSEPLPCLSKGEMEKIKQEASSIRDDDIRESFQRVMTAYLKNKKKPAHSNKD
jgi:hypothetical protein